MTPTFSPRATRCVTLFYDADCALCRRTVSWMTARDRHGSVVCEPLQNAPALAALGIGPAAALGAIHAVEYANGREVVTSGADAVLTALSYLPGYRWWSAAGRLPPLAAVARLVYARVARRRARDGNSGCCRVPTSH